MQAVVRYLLEDRCRQYASRGWGRGGSPDKSQGPQQPSDCPASLYACLSTFETEDDICSLSTSNVNVRVSRALFVLSSSFFPDFCMAWKRIPLQQTGVRFPANQAGLPPLITWHSFLYFVDYEPTVCSWSSPRSTNNSPKHPDQTTTCDYFQNPERVKCIISTYFSCDQLLCVRCPCIHVSFSAMNAPSRPTV